ncbi:MAG: hypothetical protein HY900_37510 [Deltaproteobacteria bacterium]|nr:hypothetical protein [Deltaproteobacteria bacterium]
MREERFDAGKRLAIQKARVMAADEGVMITRIRWDTEGRIATADLQIETPEKKTHGLVQQEWLEELPSGTYSPVLDATLRALVRSLRQ